MNRFTIYTSVMWLQTFQKFTIHSRKHCSLKNLFIYLLIYLRGGEWHFYKFLFHLLYLILFLIYISINLNLFYLILCMYKISTKFFLFQFIRARMLCKDPSKSLYLYFIFKSSYDLEFINNMQKYLHIHTFLCYEY